MPQSLLLVEPNDAVAASISACVSDVAYVYRHTRFESARHELLNTPFDFVATNLRLGQFNGLHLVHLASTAAIPTRAIVYTERYEPALALGVQQAGAFYETRECLEQALVAYLKGALPAWDRRDPMVRDRRRESYGGRRCWDMALLS